MTRTECSGGVYNQNWLLHCSTYLCLHVISDDSIYDFQRNSISVLQLKLLFLVFLCWLINPLLGRKKTIVEFSSILYHLVAIHMPKMDQKNILYYMLDVVRLKNRIFPLKSQNLFGIIFFWYERGTSLLAVFVFTIKYILNLLDW